MRVVQVINRQITVCTVCVSNKRLEVQHDTSYAPLKKAVNKCQIILFFRASNLFINKSKVRVLTIKSLRVHRNIVRKFFQSWQNSC